ncbi:MAG: Fic family protein [Flavobacteriales bacterium]|nr:Fic family protein [Flavobacteriales bacterium]
MDVGSITLYSISPRMLGLLTSIHQHLGEVHARHLQLCPAELAMAYRVSSVHATVAIEGGTLEPVPVADLLAHGAAPSLPAHFEVLNTHRVQELLPALDPYTAQDLRHAHAVLMHGLALDAGHFRSGPMDVLYGDPEPLRVASAHDLPATVQELLQYAEEDDFPPLLTSCVVHFGLIYLRPFTAGNGRLARLWQRRLLMRHWPVFAYLPVEAFIHQREPAYHAALEYADRRGDCGGFITYLLERIDEALTELLSEGEPVRGANDRMAVFLAQATKRPFRRKDYLAFYPELSTATATRDLREAVDGGLLQMEGEGRGVTYQKK